MTKYIRTRDNAIYESPKDNYILVGSKEVYVDFEKAKQEGCRIADTIEELCDCFIYKSNGRRRECKYYAKGKKLYEPIFDYFLKQWNLRYKKQTKNGVLLYHFYYLESPLSDDEPLTDKEIKTVKGYIWVGDNLICVAKMNENGELELI